MIKQLIDSIANHKYLNLLVGLFLFYCGLNEAWGTVYDDLIGLELHGHHGILVFGLVNVFKSLSHILKGID